MALPTTTKQASLFRTILDNISDGLYIVDLRRRITLWNEAAERISGYSAREMVGRNCSDNLLNHVDKSGKPLCTVGCPLYSTMQDGDHREDEVLLRHKNGHRLPVHVRTYPVYDEGRIVGGLELFSQKAPARYDDRLIQALTDRAMRDSLTGLPNRAYIENYMDYKLTESARYGLPFTVLAADVDNLTQFNQYYGQAVGDVMLQSMAESFANNFGEGEKVGVWRSGMFAGVFDYAAPQAAYVTVEKLRVLAERSAVYYGNVYLGLTVSAGMTMCRPGDTAQTLVSRAETLMYHSKQRGKNCCTLDIPMEQGVPAVL